MKLFYCNQCDDVVKFVEVKRKCRCGKSWGQTLSDRLHAIYGGPAVPIGLDNMTLLRAMANRPQDGFGLGFLAWVMPFQCDRAKQVSAREAEAIIKQDKENSINDATSLHGKAGHSGRVPEGKGKHRPQNRLPARRT